MMTIFDKITQIAKNYIKEVLYGKGIKRYFKIRYFPHVSPNARLGINIDIASAGNLYMEGNSTFKDGVRILNARAKFIIKKNSGSAENLVVITGNHMSIPSLNVKQVTNAVKDAEDINNEYDKDVIVEEDVWIGADVTLLSGVHISRGCEIGTGAVVRKSTPPYSVVIGNPAKVVGFRFTPEEIIEHEKVQYPEEERLPLEILEKNYNKYYLSKIKEIREYTRLSL